MEEGLQGTGSRCRIAIEARMIRYARAAAVKKAPCFG